MLGVLFALTINTNNTIIKDNQNFIVKFLHTFTLNFWIVFLMWLIGKYKELFIINFLISFVKTFMLGLIFVINIKSNNLFNYLKYFIVDFFVFLPLIIFILYQNLMYFLNKIKRLKYDLLIIVYTIWCILYASLSSFVGSKI